MELETLKTKLKPISIDNSAKITKEYFDTNYGFPEKPVLFSSAFEDWAIKDKFSLDFLKEHLRDIEIFDSDKQELPKKAMTLAQYLESGLTMSYYYKSQQHLRDPDLQQNNLPRDIFQCWYAGNAISKPKKQLSWLYIGGEGTYSDTHRDIWGTSAWNYLVEGKKLWLIYPKVNSNLIKKNKTEFSLSAIENNLQLFLYKPMYCIQEEGQLVFVPNHCYHAVYNLSLTVSVTENFINETNYDNVRSFFRGGTNKKNIADIESIIKGGFERIRSKNNIDNNAN